MTYRCAVYTRKSHEEGLDQDFNSLDAQYEACSAYIASQAGLGWTLRDKRYDCLLYTSPSPRDATLSRMPSSA